MMTQYTRQTMLFSLLVSALFLLSPMQAAQSGQADDHYVSVPGVVVDPFDFEQRGLNGVDLDDNCLIPFNAAPNPRLTSYSPSQVPEDAPVVRLINLPPTRAPPTLIS